MGSIEKDEEFQILGTYWGWVKIETSTKTTGWASLTWINIDKDSVDKIQIIKREDHWAWDDNLTKVTSVIVTYGDVTMKFTVDLVAGPSTGSSYRGKAMRGEKVRLLERCQDWIKIETSKQVIGWTAVKYISLARKVPDQCWVSEATSNPRDIEQAKNFLRSLPFGCSNSYTSTASDGAVIIKIRCKVANDYLYDEIRIKDGRVIKIK